MSWDAYVSDNLMAPLDTEGNTLTSAALVGLDGAIWASSPEFPEITTDEITALVESMAVPSKTSFEVAGVKYMKLQGDDKVLRCRKDKGGFIARKTGTALVVGFYTEPQVDARTCNKVVEALGDYLEEAGY